MSEENYSFLIQKLRNREKIISIYRDLLNHLENNYPDDYALIDEFEIAKKEIAKLREYGNEWIVKVIKK